MSEHEGKVVVIDSGTDTCKVGLSGEHKPKCLMPTLVGRHENPDGHIHVDGGEGPTKDLYLGFEAESRRTLLTMSSPITRGLITNWDDMQLLWEHAIRDELGVTVSQHSVLLADTPNNPDDAREKMAEIFLEALNVPSIYIANQSVLSLYSEGKTTGTVVDIGHSVTSAVPVHDGYSVSENVVRVELGGADLTDYLVKMLSDRDYNFSNPSDRAHVQDIKEQFCYVAPDFQKEIKKLSKPKPSKSATADGGSILQHYELPDGQVISVKSERFRCPEALFQPQMLEMNETPPLHMMIEDAISKCDSDIRKALFNNVLLCGGSSLFEGLVDRLSHELARMHRILSKPKVSMAKEALAAGWIGGSIFADMSTFQDMHLTKQEYDEAGKEVVHKKFFK